MSSSYKKKLLRNRLQFYNLSSYSTPSFLG